MNHVEEQILKSGRRLRGNIVLRRSGDLLFIGGHGPEDEVTGEPFYTGRLGRELTVEDGYKAPASAARSFSAPFRNISATWTVDYLVKRSACEQRAGFLRTTRRDGRFFRSDGGSAG